MARQKAGTRQQRGTKIPRGEIIPVPVIAPPAAPSNLVPTAFSSSAIDLNWQRNSVNELFTRIEESVNGTSGWTEIATVGPGITTYRRASLAADTTRYYRIRTSNLAGDGATIQYSSYSNIGNAKTQSAIAPQAPSAVPTSLTVTPGTDGQGPKMTLAWAAPTGPTPAGYRIEATYVDKNNNGQDMAGWRLVDRCTTVGYVDRLLEPGLLKRYRIVAFYGGGTVSGPSTVVSATCPAAVHTSIPDNPTALVAGAISDTQVDLQAYVSSDNEDGFRYEISTNGGTSWTPLPTAPGGALFYRVTGLNPSTPYKFRVFAYNNVGDCASPAVSATVTTLAAGQVLCPTGYNPRVWWNYEWHQRWQQAKADYEANPVGTAWPIELYKELKGSADEAINLGYNRVGRHEAMMYLITGDTAYASKAYDTLFNFKLSVASTNDVSEMYTDLCVVAECIYNGLTTQKQNDMLAMLLIYADFVLSTDVIATGTINNSDGSATTQFCKSSLVGRLDNFYRSNISVKFVTGPNAGQSRTLGNYVTGSLKYYTGADGGFYLNSALPFAPTNGDQIEIGYLGYAASAKVNDSDLNCGAVLGILLTDLLVGAWGSPRGGTLATSIQSGPNGAIPIGGYGPVATPSYNSNRAGLTAAIIQSRGGVWIESSEYNLGTTNFMEMGTKALSDASPGNYYGRDAFRLWKEIGEHLVVNTCPGIETSGGQYQWGDVDNYARTVNLPAYVQSVAAAAGVNRGRPVSNALHDLLNRLWYSGRTYAKEPYVRYFFWVDPYLPRTDYRTYASTHYARGMGMMTVKDNPTDPNSSLFGFTANQDTGVDHVNYWMGDHQLYRNREWVIYSPIGYGQGAPVNSERISGVLFAGLSPKCRCRGPLRQQFGTGYAYASLDASGQTVDQTYYNPPPTFIHEYTRHTVHLPSTDGSVGTNVVVDRALLANPKFLANLTRYPGFNSAGAVTTPVATTSEDADRIVNRAIALFARVVHIPVASPTLGSGFTQWLTPVNSQTVRIDHLFPSDVVRSSVLDENLSSVMYGGSSWQPNEKKYQIKLTPAVPWPSDSTPTFYFMLNVEQAGTPGTNTPITSNGGEAKGALVQRAGHDDFLLLFGAQATEPTIRAGFTVTFTQGSTSGRVLLFLMDPTKTWTYTVNGGASTPLTVSSQGVADIPTSGSGAKTIVLTAS